jgi:dienelactone hydrolase
MTDPTNQGLVYTVAGTADVKVEHLVYSTEQGPLDLDLYRPLAGAAPAPVVVLATGLPDPGVAAMLGKPLKDWASYIGWGRMIAASGISAVTYANRTPADAVALVQHLRANAGALGLDPARIGVWACSGHVPNALALIARERVACAVLLYGYMLDLDGSTRVASAAKQFYFAAPPVALDDLPRELPILVVRAGRDETPGLNETQERFLAAARARQMAVTMIEHAEAPHAFEMQLDTPRTREVIDEMLAFLRQQLG